MSTPLHKNKFKNQAQTRTLFISHDGAGEKRFDTDYYVEGYAARYERYLLIDNGEYGKIYEQFDRHCFDNTDMSDVIMQYDHAGRVFARTTNKTLIVEPDDNGLFMAGDLKTTEGSRSLYDDIKAELITKMSWRFRIGKYRIEKEEGSRDITIVHTEISKIYDVSAVSIPANNDTEINARDFVNGVIDEMTRREVEREEKRRKLLLKIKIHGGKK